MKKMTLVIGNQNYSSWSLRAWILLRHAGIVFSEEKIFLYQNDSKEKLNQWSPSGLVPALHDGDLVVYESLAICEYLNEKYPGKQLWPQDIHIRAHTRSMSTQIHSGFSSLKNTMPMNCRATLPGKGMNEQTGKDIQSILKLWKHCRQSYGDKGPFLFGDFSIADAMFAPVVSRLHTYRVDVDEVTRDYMETILSLPAMKEWYQAGADEEEVIEAFEI